MNKSDLLEHNDISEKIDYLELKDNKKCIPVSAKTSDNLEKLKDLIKNVIDNQQSPQPTKKSLKKELEEIYGN